MGSASVTGPTGFICGDLVGRHRVMRGRLRPAGCPGSLTYLQVAAEEGSSQLGRPSVGELSRFECGHYLARERLESG